MPSAIPMPTNPSDNALRMPMKKPTLYTELAFFLGLMLLAMGTALTAYGGLGISMVVAPAYLLHLFVSQFVSWFSFGMAEYVLQALILIVLMLVLRTVKFSYILSFVATLLYSFMLDKAMALTALLPANAALQIVAYLVGAVICCSALALLFCSYFPPQAYELFSKEMAAKLHKPIYQIVNYYNIGSLALAVILSLAFFGGIQGIGIGTVLCALLYGLLIRFFQKIYGKLLRIKDRFPLRKFLEESEETS